MFAVSQAAHEIADDPRWRGLAAAAVTVLRRRTVARLGDDPLVFLR